ncbi:MAG TPA: DcaP family trimeric outer membrane transporter [Thermodesulfobacteriota bacterium]|nr:hypothetical protein [Deltaproteobacteria bacterium]HNR12980.1 DcaP family trimeric outer membrane transporter [Thermodesulfobacteriota bacterium]HNU72360.1 DcaP family trimeric outer membrane transporter [Thermodesulfobacteriota bacterium]HOC38601.1 DcaP family trimeric outer membrane transporter [Thermodesulfobacteriota bacterium]
MRSWILVTACVVIALITSALPVNAQPTTDELQKRIEMLEQQLQDLKQIMQQQQQTQQADQARVKKVEERVGVVEQVKEKAPTVLSSFQFKPYGYVKLDASWDDSRTNYGNFILYVPNESAHNNENDFNMTARQTRIGMDILAPQYGNWVSKGRIEFDFYGDGTQRHENKAEVMMRHAFIDLTNGKYNIIAGQTSDLISPLVPNNLNYTVGWAAGNIGYRRPQLRGTYTTPLNDANKLIAALAIARTAGTINEDLDLDLENDGEDTGWPTLQGRIALSTKAFTETESVFGISGHYGEEEVDFDLIASDEDDQEHMRSWSLNLDFLIPISKCLGLSGEAFIGDNLDDYFGGIVQGVNAIEGDEVMSRGGWAQVSYQPYQQWKTNFGFGIDDPDNGDINAGGRTFNKYYYANVLYNLIPPVTLGLEYSYWNTGIKDQSNGTDNRIQTSIIYAW